MDTIAYAPRGMLLKGQTTEAKIESNDIFGWHTSLIVNYHRLTVPCVSWASLSTCEATLSKARSFAPANGLAQGAYRPLGKHRCLLGTPVKDLRMKQVFWCVQNITKNAANVCKGTGRPRVTSTTAYASARKHARMGAVQASKRLR